MYRSDLCDSTFPYDKCNSVYKNYFVEEAVRTIGLRFGEDRLQDLCSDEAIVQRHCLSYCTPKEIVYDEDINCQTNFSEASIEKRAAIYQDMTHPCHNKFTEEKRKEDCKVCTEKEIINAMSTDYPGVKANLKCLGPDQSDGATQDDCDFGKYYFEGDQNTCSEDCFVEIRAWNGCKCPSDPACDSCKDLVCFACKQGYALDTSQKCVEVTSSSSEGSGNA